MISDKENKKNKQEISLNVLKKKSEEYLAGWQRAKADLINYKKEEAKRLRDAHEYGKLMLFERLLGVLDAFDRAEKAVPAEIRKQPWAQGFLKIREELLRSLEEEGIVSIKSEGKLFDPSKHEALEEVEVGNETEKGKVIEELQRGYLYKGAVIRPSRVRVGK